MALGDSIRKYRKELNITQEELGKRANISRTYVVDIEKGRYKPSIQTLGDIAAVLGVTVVDLLSDEQNIQNLKNEFISVEFLKCALKQFYVYQNTSSLNKEKIFKFHSDLYWESKEKK